MLNQIEREVEFELRELHELLHFFYFSDRMVQEEGRKGDKEKYIV